MIDTHTHLYAEELAADREKMIAKAVAGGVKKMLMPNIDSSSIEPMLEVERQFGAHCLPMMGLHPCYVLPETVDAELKTVETWLKSRSFCGLGEIGIDLHWRQDTLELQKMAFETQLQWAMDYNLVVSVHCRKGFEVILGVLQKYGANPKCRGVLHCFGGSVAQAQELISYGFLLGIGGVVTYKKSGLSEVLQSIDLQHIVLETDAPYLAPVPHRGQRNESGYLGIIAQKVAEIYGKTLAEIDAITTENAEKMFAI